MDAEVFAIPTQRGPANRSCAQDQAIRALFDEHYDRLCRLAVLVGAEDEAEDVVAEAFYELHRRWSEIADSAAAVGYLSATIRNLVRMRIRHKQVVRKHERRVLPDAERNCSAEHEVLVKVTERTLSQALGRLPNRQRQAIVLRFWMDFKDREIAAAMGISLGSVKVHIYRGLAGLKSVLQGVFTIESDFGLAAA